MRVAVGSMNPVKIDAVREVLEGFYEDIEVFGTNAESGVREQPMGMEETIKGAISRAEQALMEGDLGVGIEAGLIEVPYTISGYFDVQFCGVTDGKRITLGSGSGFEYPKDVISEVKSGKDIGEIVSRISGIAEIGNKMGAIGFFSGGRLTRKELTKQAVLMAMVPFTHGAYMGKRNDEKGKMR